MTLDEMEKLARSRVDSKERDLRDIKECRRMEAINTLTGAALGMTEDAANLARALLLVVPVVRAACRHEDTRRAVLGGKDTHAELLRRGEDLENPIDTMRAAMKEGK